MQHLEDGFLHEIADGEVPSADLVAVREHLDQCESCRARLDEARNEAETARELIELIEVPMGAVGAVEAVAAVKAVGAARPRGARWVRPVAWAASLVLAAGIGYMTRSENEAALAAPRMDPLSIGRVDTVYLDIPAQAQPAPSQPAEADQSLQSVASRTLPQAPRPNAESPLAAAPPARQRAAGARAEEEQSLKRRADLDTTNAPRDELLVTNAVTDAKKAESKDANAKLAEGARERATQLRSNRAQPATPPAVVAEDRMMAKTAAEAAPTIISFPRAAELLGGRIKLIEGMVPARLEAVGRTVRVIYVIDEGNLVLAQVAASDSLNWSLSGSLSADSLASLRLKVR